MHRLGFSTSAALLVGFAVVLAGCSEVLGKRTHWLRADVVEIDPAVAGLAPDTYHLEGPGHYSLSLDPETRLSTTFGLYTQQRLAAEDRDVLLSTSASALPSVGRHAVGTPDSSGRNVGSFTIVVGRSTAERSERYVATEGWVEITSVAGGVIEGSFRGIARQVSLTLAEPGRGLQNIVRDDPLHAPSATAPRIEVSGTFRAVHFSQIPIEQH
jgi:hypothetical protein